MFHKKVTVFIQCLCLTLVGDDKFVNTLFTKVAKSSSASMEVQQLLNKWREQTDFSFGFVPLSEFIVPNVLKSREK